MDLQKLQSQLIRHEGIKLKPYLDSVGKLTIGVGHNLDARGLTHAQAMSILFDDMTDAVSFLTLSLPWFKDLDEVRQRALADMAFNLMERLLEFTQMLHALETKDWSTASAQLLNSKFARQTGQRARDLAYMLKTGTDPER